MAKLTKRAIDALPTPDKGQTFHWDTETRGFGIRVGASGAKTFIIQYRNVEDRSRRVKIGRYGIFTVEQARDLAKIKLGEVAAGGDPAEEIAQARKDASVAELCDWYLEEARAGRILGRRNRPIKASTLNMDESRIKTHIKPLVGHRIARHLTIADVEAMQTDVVNGKTAKPRTGGRGGVSTGGTGVAPRVVSTLQSVLGHAKHKGLLKEHPTKGARKLATNKKKRRLSVAEIEDLGAAMVVAERNGENPVGIAIVKLLLLTGFRRQEGQAMQRDWLNAGGGYVAFPDTKGDAQLRAVGAAAITLIQDQPAFVGNLHVFPSADTDGPITTARDCLARLCAIAKIADVTPHTLRHTFGSVAGDLSFSELTIAAMLGHAAQTITQGYIHVDEALRLAVARTSEEMVAILNRGANRADRPLRKAA
ncbi:integrase family protein [Novosphingobium sp.]|uniref:integrase family protein n=1 Tax=Novosphingobium sp. TaxID=1874826 RepID=UPI00286B0227|nr:integrase family protein [Novosphingobium sp.]